MEWHRLEPERTFLELNADRKQGLSDAEASRRLAEDGANELSDRRGRSPLRMFWRQFPETMVVILTVAAIVSAMLGKANETLAILAIVIMFALPGYDQE